MSVDIRLIREYINGSIFDEETLNKLENDYDFMRNCIIITNDKNLYNLCSDELKVNYEFNYFLLNHFNNDYEFIDKIVMYYLYHNKVNNNGINVKPLELLLAALDIIDDKKLTNKYKSLLYSAYYCELTVIKRLLSELKKDNRIADLNMLMKGYIIIYTDFKDSKRVLNYMSKLFLNEIINEYNADAEELLHKNFINYADLKSYGFNSFIIDYIRNYDSLFGNYLACNIDIINNCIDKEYINNHWDIYNENSIDKVYYNIVRDVHDYFIDNGEDILFGEYSTLFYVAKEFNVLDKIKEKTESDCLFDFNQYMIDTKFLFETSKLSDDDKMHLFNIKKIFQTNLNDDKKYLSKDKLNNIVFLTKKNKNNC